VRQATLATRVVLGANGKLSSTEPGAGPLAAGAARAFALALAFAFALPFVVALRPSTSLTAVALAWGDGSAPGGS
jgi:hypothetical protein